MEPDNQNTLQNGGGLSVPLRRMEPEERDDTHDVNFQRMRDTCVFLHIRHLGNEN